MGVLQTLRLGPNGELLLPSALRESLRLEPGDLVQVGIETEEQPSVTLMLSARRPGMRRLQAPSRALANIAQSMALEGKCLVQVFDDETLVVEFDGRDQAAAPASQVVDHLTENDIFYNANALNKDGTVEDLVGCVDYRGPPVSVEAMSIAVGQAIAERRRHE